MSIRLLTSPRTGNGVVPAPKAIQTRAGSATLDDDGTLPLPRYLLVGLHALAADIALIRESHGTDARLCASLDLSLSRLDGLVDSIYDQAATARMPQPGRPSTNGTPPTNGASPTNGGPPTNGASPAKP